MSTKAPTILLVDDDADFRLLTIMQLEFDYQLSEVSSGEEALSFITNKRPDLVLLDFEMGGMDGQATLEALREHYDDDELPVLMLSGHQTPDKIANALDAGANDYISKDVHPRVLQARIRRHLKSRSITQDNESVLGEYRIKSSLGRNSWSSFFLLEHSSHQESRTARLIKPGFSIREDILENLPKVPHPRVSNVVSWSTDPVVYISSEYVPGQSLRDYVANSELGIFPALGLTKALVELLQVVEEAGAFHGDLNPDQILVDKQGHVAFSELGLIRGLVQDNKVTATDFSFGDPAFQSPERIKNTNELDIRADLYSLGALFFYLLTGSAPFEGSVESVRKSALQEMAPLVSEKRADNVKRFDGVIAKLLSKEPGERYQSVEELASDFSHFEIPSL